MNKREVKQLTAAHDKQPAMMRRLWILSVGSIFALFLSGSILAASWLQASGVPQPRLSPTHTAREQIAPTTGVSSSISLPTATTPTIPAQLTILATPVLPPASTNQHESIKPRLIATTGAVFPGVPITHITDSSGATAPNLAVTMYFPSGYAIPAGESLTFNDIVSNAPNTGKTTGPITLSQTIPAGLNAVKAFGTGWTITAQPLQGPGTLKAVYTNTLAPGDSVPPLTIFGIIARNARSILHMNAQVSTNGNNGNASEESAADVTVTPPL